MYLTFDPKYIVKALTILAVVLVLMHVISIAFISQSVNPLSEVLVEKFSLEGEGNFPAYFSSFLLLSAGILFVIISKGTRLQGQSLWK